jgi:uncharacterized protein (DUF1697 family)
VKTWIALLRGINVGGHNRLPMKSLSLILESAGCEQVSTYIQSGNVVFKGDVDSVGQFGEKIGRAIEKEHGFCPAIRLLTADELRAAIASNPYPQAVSEPKSLHLSFLERPPQDECISGANRLLSETESFTVVGSLLYLYAPDGVARSRFANRVDKVLQMKTTARNWRTVMKLEALASAIE